MLVTPYTCKTLRQAYLSLLVTAIYTSKTGLLILVTTLYMLWTINSFMNPNNRPYKHSYSIICPFDRPTCHGNRCIYPLNKPTEPK